MGDKSRIEWTEATWNPVTGCTKVSPGCAHCYAERMARWFAGRNGYPKDDPFRVTLQEHRLDQPLRWRRPRMIFTCSMSDLFHEDVPRFHLDHVFAVMLACAVFENRRHTFQVLTKRPERMLAYLTSRSPVEHLQTWAKAGNGWILCDDPDITFEDAVAHHCSSLDAAWTETAHLFPLPNVWAGTSVENQRWADERVPILLETPAAVRFLSCEPLLGPVDLRLEERFAEQPCPRCEGKGYHHGFGEGGRDPDWCLACGGPGVVFPTAIHWVIVGGESGPGARPLHPDWARGLRDQCQAASVPFFFKQWGEWAPFQDQPAAAAPTWAPAYRDLTKHVSRYVTADGKVDGVARYGSARMLRLGKKAAGRLLDGQTWDQFPEPERVSVG